LAAIEARDRSRPPAALRIVEHRSDWGSEFQRIAAALSAGVGEVALRVDHIGSTSVPGLCAAAAMGNSSNASPGR
jgi:GrpB-like predicted nucleotidyltransferase (UPF0157 family)